MHCAPGQCTPVCWDCIPTSIGSARLCSLESRHRCVLLQGDCPLPLSVESLHPTPFRLGTGIFDGCQLFTTSEHGRLALIFKEKGNGENGLDCAFQSCTWGKSVGLKQKTWYHDAALIARFFHLARTRPRTGVGRSCTRGTLLLALGRLPFFFVTSPFPVDCRLQGKEPHRGAPRGWD